LEFFSQVFLKINKFKNSPPATISLWFKFLKKQ
jgi:hypothetical protein